MKNDKRFEHEIILDEDDEIVPHKFVFSNERFENLDFYKACLEEAIFENCRFVDCNFHRANLKLSHFTNCKFEGCDLSFSNLDRAMFDDCKFTISGFEETSRATVLTGVYFGSIHDCLSCDVRVVDLRYTTKFKKCKFYQVTYLSSFNYSTGCDSFTGFGPELGLEMFKKYCKLLGLEDKVKNRQYFVGGSYPENKIGFYDEM